MAVGHSSEHSQFVAGSEGLVADLKLSGWDLALVGAALQRDPEVGGLIAHCLFEEHGDGSVVILAITIVNRLCHNLIVLVKENEESVVLAGLIGTDVDVQVERFSGGHGELENIVSAGLWNGDGQVVHVEVVVRDELVLEEAHRAIERRDRTLHAGPVGLHLREILIHLSKEANEICEGHSWIV